MLVLLTMFAVSAVTLSASTSKVVGNMQAKKTTDALAQRVVDQVISEGLFGDKRLVPVTPSWTPAGMTIQVTERHCRGVHADAARPADGDLDLGIRRLRPRQLHGREILHPAGRRGKDAHRGHALPDFGFRRYYLLTVRRSS